VASRLRIDGYTPLCTQGNDHALDSLGVQPGAAFLRLIHRVDRVAAIDTTGAGDAFVGCLAAALAMGRSRDESIGRALLYSALSTTRRGAQVSYPKLEEFERSLSARTANDNRESVANIGR
jgi:sugar/nucleoside kinase (ribokinase family)